MQSPQATVESYVAAWGAADAGARRALLERAWSDDGTYTDPTAHVAGREALVAHIGGFIQRFPGARFAFTGTVDAHHGMLRFGWRIVGPDGGTILAGVDFGELDADGRLRRIVGFFDAAPGAPDTPAPAGA